VQTEGRTAVERGAKALRRFESNKSEESELKVSIILSLFIGRAIRDYCVTIYRRKMTDTREYPQYFVKKI
jgi:hypothetical protein